MSHSTTQPTQPVETAFADTPLYTPPSDWHDAPHPYTVTIAGPERHDGERPYICIVEAHTTEQAWAQALGWFILDQSTTDAYVIADQSSPGLPMPGSTYVWNDLRPTAARRYALDAIAQRAATIVTDLAQATEDLIDENGEILPGHRSTHRRAIADADGAAWSVVEDLARQRPPS